MNEAWSTSVTDGGGYRCTETGGGVADDEACAAVPYPAACAGSCEQPAECNDACAITKAHFTTSVTESTGASFPYFYSSAYGTDLTTVNTEVEHIVVVQHGGGRNGYEYIW